MYWQILSVFFNLLKQKGNNMTLAFYQNEGGIMAEETKSNVILIRDYFKCELAEIKALTPKDKQELGEMIRKELASK